MITFTDKNMAVPRDLMWDQSLRGGSGKESTKHLQGTRSTLSHWFRSVDNTWVKNQANEVEVFTKHQLCGTTSGSPVRRLTITRCLFFNCLVYSTQKELEALILRFTSVLEKLNNLSMGAWLTSRTKDTLLRT